MSGIWLCTIPLLFLHVWQVNHRVLRINPNRTVDDTATSVSYPKKPKHIILIAVDTLRADHTSMGGYPRGTTPRVNKMARREGIVFENAYSSSSWTLPSSVSLLTSLPPNIHEVEDREQTLHPDVPTLAGAFSKQGWRSAAFVTHIYVSSLFGVDSGFDEFHELSIDWGFNEGSQLRAAELNDAVFPWLEKNKDTPFFLYLHYFDPHWDYDPPEPFKEKFTDPDYHGEATGTWSYIRQYIDPEQRMPIDALGHVIDLYDGEIAYTDQELDRLFNHLKSQKMWDDSLVVLLSDHGEEFKDHGSMHHIRTLYEEVLHVPLIVKLPGGRPKGWKKRIQSRVGTIDVGPTLLDIARKDIPPSFQGGSLVPLLKNGGPDRDIFARTVRHRSDTMALIMDGRKLVMPFGRNPNPIEYFDLEKDPLEQSSEVRGYPREVDFFVSEIENRLKTTALDIGLPGAGKEVNLSEDQKTLLRNLGYME